jgi:ectoine hydroxylase-related dioxygenase (phytanoyl-CoA dioxygenase family)
VINADFFYEHGYQVFEDILPVELIDETRSILEKDAQISLTRAQGEIGCVKDGLVEAINAIAHGVESSVERLSKASRDTFSGHISLDTRLSPSLRKIPSHPGVQAVVRAVLMSEKIFMHMPPTARFVLPGNIHAGVPAHQDISYNRHLSNFVVIWVPLVDIDDDCGGVLVYDGSGFEPERTIAKDARGFWQSGVSVEGFEPIHCKIRRGSVLALNKWVIHASMLNKSHHTRFSIDHRFFGEGDVSSKHYLDLQTNQIVAPEDKEV